MNDREPDPQRDDDQVREVAAEETPDEVAAVKAEAAIGPVMPTPARRPAGIGIGRWLSFGCLAAMIILVVLLVIGVGLTKRTAWMAVARAQQRVTDRLPSELSSGGRLRIDRNLQRFRARLRATPDPYPLIGEFLNRVRAVLEDDELTVDEVSDLNRYLESILDADRIDGAATDR